MKFCMTVLRCAAALCFSVVGKSSHGSHLSERPRETKDAGVPATHNDESYDLSKDEERGGHTLRKHVGRTDEQLRQRLQQERNISAASTWTDRTAAEETVQAALHAERGKIEKWNTARRTAVESGVAFLRWTRNWAEFDSLVLFRAVPCTEAVVVLRADGAGFYVLTTYPEARE